MKYLSPVISEQSQPGCHFKVFVRLLSSPVSSHFPEDEKKISGDRNSLYLEKPLAF
jgi:hypothetical protein